MTGSSSINHSVDNKERRLEDIKVIRELAENNFNSGLLCAESVVSAIAEYQGIDNILIPKMATAFCSGMGRTCGTCGALSGAILGLSLGLGRESTADSVEASYDATTKLVTEFEREFGAKDCHKLLGCDIGTPEGRLIFKSQNLRERCVEFTGKATEIAVKILGKMSNHVGAVGA